MKDYDKSKESSYLKYWDVNNLHGWAMPQQKLPVNNFAWIENTSEFNADLINIYNEESHEGYFFKLMSNILKNYMTFSRKWTLHELQNFIMIYHL